jgi:multicomponent Na+:H+ antiporter subunit B
MIGLIVLAILIMLIFLAILIVSNDDLPHSVILFMGFGLGSVILYFLFSAPDVALTEAVIGTGVSTVVFLVTLLQIKSKGLDI